MNIAQRIVLGLGTILVLTVALTGEQSDQRTIPAFIAATAFVTLMVGSRKRSQ